MNNFKNKPFDVKTLKGKQIAIVGGGVEGQSSANYLKKNGASVTILDRTQGEDYLSNLDAYDLIVRSPGIKPSLIINHKSSIMPKVISQTELFLELCPSKVIGVTGTKGKGTTSSLIYEMLKKQGFDAYLGGNIGVPPLEFLDNLNTHSIVVLELSSFQLIDIKKSPQIAVILMTTSEHLDYHKDVFEYINAKRNIFKFQKEEDFAIVNKDYLASRESDVETIGQVYYVSAADEALRGCFVKDNAIWIRNGDLEEKILNTQEILIPGVHNYENACAAAMAAYLAGVQVHNITQVLKTFKGLEHRLELVATVNGVKYYDDSFSTTPETAIAAINAFDAPEVLILGGSSKKSDFSELGSVISNSLNIKAIIGVGEEWERIKSEILSPKSEIYFIEGADNMEKIITAAYKISAPGDVVLLTPACASFGMFKNYKDRGEQYKKQVLALKQNESN